MAITKAGMVNSRGTATIDSYPLTVALDSGYIGLGLYFWIFVVFAIKAVAWAVMGDSDAHAQVAAAVVAVISLFLTFTIVSTNHNITMYWLLMYLPFGIWARQALFVEKNTGRGK